MTVALCDGVLSSSDGSEAGSSEGTLEGSSDGSTVGFSVGSVVGSGAESYSPNQVETVAESSAATRDFALVASSSEPEVVFFVSFR